MHLTREEHAVAVEGQVGVLHLMERLEIVRVAHADGRAVIAIAPRDVVAVLQPAQSRVVAVDELRDLRVVALELDRLVLDVPVDAVLALAKVEVHDTPRVINTEHTDKAALVRDDSAIEDAVGLRNQVARDDRVL